MNARASFDTHAFIKRLEGAGMEGRQAEALAEALGEIVFETTATKGDLREFAATMKSDLRELGSTAKSDLRELELRLTNDLRELELRLNNRLGVTVGGATALTVAILGALITLA
jgi:hypothetical protein